MICECCGGDGLIEYGAYRGDDDTDTRKCHLCGGTPVINTVRESVSGSRQVLTLRSTVNNEVLPRQREQESRRSALRIAREHVERKRITLENTGQMTGDEIMEDLVRKGLM